LQRARILVLALIFLALSVVVVSRLYQLQVVDWREYSLKAASIHRSVLYTPGPRGEIQDRYGEVLSRSVPEIRATFLLSELEPVRWVARRIARILRNAPEERYPWDEDKYYESIERVRADFRTQISSGEQPHEVPWLINIDKAVGGQLDRTIRKRPEAFPGVRLQKGDGVDALFIDPMKLFAGELGIRRLAEMDGRKTADELWSKVQGVYEWIRTGVKPYIRQDFTQGERELGPQEATEIFRYQRHSLLDNLTPEVVTEISLNPENWPGIYLEEIQRREQPHSPFLGQLIGRTGKLTRENITDWEQRGEVLINYLSLKDLRTIELIRDVAHHSADQVGKSGLEGFLEERLRGSPGAHIRTVDYLRRPIGGPGLLIEAKEGQDVQLTIDAEFSRVGTDLLQKALDDVWPDGAPSSPIDTAAMVFIDVKSGEIIGLSSLPQQGSEVYRDKNLYSERAESEDAKKMGWFYDRCLGWAIEPGSTFKPMIALLAYAQGELSADEEIRCQGVFDPRYPNRNRCRNHLYGSMGVKSAISKSCNIFFYELGQRLGLDRIVAGGREMGLWKSVIGPVAEFRTGQYRVLPTESVGMPPATNPVGTAIGSGFTVTPLQMAQASMFIALRGEMVPVKLFLGSGGWVSEDSNPPRDLLGQLNDTHFSAVIEGMIEATRTGSARSSSLQEFSVAVKTGTVTVPQEKKIMKGTVEENHAWLMGFAPHHDPKVAFAAVLQHQPGSGGDVADAVTDALEWLEENREMEFRR